MPHEGYLSEETIRPNCEGIFFSKTLHGLHRWVHVGFNAQIQTYRVVAATLQTHSHSHILFLNIVTQLY